MEKTKVKTNGWKIFGWLILALVGLVALLWVLALVPFSGKVKRFLDHSYLGLARQLMFVPTYYFPLSVADYSYYDSDLGREVTVGYGFIDSLTGGEEITRTDQNALPISVAEPAPALSLNVKKVLTGKKVNFNLSATDLEEVVLAFFYIRNDIFLPSGVMTEIGLILETTPPFSRRPVPLVASFDEFKADNLAEGDFVRWFRDSEKGNLLRLDLLDVSF